MTNKSFVKIAAFSIAISIVFGAFGAHALKEHFSSYYMDVWNKGIFYQIINSLGIIALILLEKSEFVKKVKVWGGKKSNLNMLFSEDINLLLNIRTKRNLNAKILFNEPIIAPVKEDQVIGKLILFNDKEEIMDFNLISGEKIERNNIFGRTIQKIGYLIN